MQTEPAVQRMRLTFSKDEAARFISHLDLARALERALNRAGLPIAHTQGFNRRPRLSLAAALPLGYTGAAELADVWMVESVAADHFHRQLGPAMPPGVTLKDVAEAPLSEPSLQQQIVESWYEARFLDALDGAALRSRVAALLEAAAVPYERVHPRSGKRQSVDLRPLIVDLTVGEGEDGRPRLALRLVQTATQTGRPDDILTALGFDPLDARVHRLAIRLASAEPASWPTAG